MDSNCHFCITRGSWEGVVPRLSLGSVWRMGRVGVEGGNLFPDYEGHSSPQGFYESCSVWVPLTRSCLTGSSLTPPLSWPNYYTCQAHWIHMTCHLCPQTTRVCSANCPLAVAHICESPGFLGHFPHLENVISLGFWSPHLCRVPIWKQVAPGASFAGSSYAVGSKRLKAQGSKMSDTCFSPKMAELMPGLTTGVNWGKHRALILDPFLFLTSSLMHPPPFSASCIWSEPLYVAECVEHKEMQHGNNQPKEYSVAGTDNVRAWMLHKLLKF